MNPMRVFSLLCLLGVLVIGPWVVCAAEGPMIDVNHATASELAELTGVGRARAQAIVDYRQTHPPFRSAEDLLKVRGIGRFVLEHNRGRLRFAGDDEGAVVRQVSVADRPARTR